MLRSIKVKTNMGKVSRKHLNEESLAAYINRLWSAFALMPTKADTRLLFNDLITRTEKEMLAKRFEIACRLLDEQSYDEIQNDLNVTSGTIATVSEVLAEKGEGFRTAYKKLCRIEERRRQNEIGYIKNLENPFRRKMSRKTLLGAVLKAGLSKVDSKITAHIKKKSASKHLPV